MNIFYSPTSSITPNSLKLTGQEAKHATKVLRVRVGDQIHVTDGAGQLYHCEVADIQKSDVICNILDTNTEKRKSPYVTLVIGLIKKRDRLEFAVEKSVELGVDEIIVFRGDHSEKGNVRLDRLESTVLSAMKQSLRVFLPQVSFVENLSDAVDAREESTSLIYADETFNERGLESRLNNKLMLIVGPEGGFSESERNLMKKLGGIPYSLGEKRLRTETAAVSITDRYKNGLL
ncbi:RsmE family RNA methyltransferase [Rhodohalobacter sp.]|uniref:RsmE family RNA methyltransferase n=1 Tax=Rhodohalobacter sp. TaxID=1974210 RepID=UPI002ACE87EB|nr:RsmE family RNA methyltransferase [Rhodohalobacter sp.]MDZ7756905.1 RsmE family RNA methyltransferase [Rhodohalobacter sp.]